MIFLNFLESEHVYKMMPNVIGEFEEYDMLFKFIVFDCEDKWNVHIMVHLVDGKYRIQLKTDCAFAMMVQVDDLVVIDLQ